MIFYCGLLFLILILSGRYRIGKLNSPKHITNIIVYILLSMVSVCRFDVGWDYPAYYKLLSPVLDVKNVQKIEFIPRIFAYVANFLGSPFFFFFLFGIFTYFFVFATIEKYSDEKYESLIIYFCVFYFDSFGIIRQALAYALLFWGYRFIKEKDFFKYLVICIVAFFIHKSAIIGLSIYFIINYFKIVPTIFLSVFMYIGKKLLLDRLTILNFYSYYLNNLNKYAGGSKIQFFYILILIILLFVYYLTNDKIRRNELHCEGLLSVIAIGSVMPFLFGAMGLRVGLYFTVYLLLVWPKIMQKFNIKSKVALVSLFYLYFILFLGVSVRNTEKSPFTPYQNYFISDKVILK